MEDEKIGGKNGAGKSQSIDLSLFGLQFSLSIDGFNFRWLAACALVYALISASLIVSFGVWLAPLTTVAQVALVAAILAAVGIALVVVYAILFALTKLAKKRQAKQRARTGPDVLSSRSVATDPRAGARDAPKSEDNSDRARDLEEKHES